MKIGYLHLGFPEHGIRRYGEVLAQAAQRSNIDVMEETIVLGQDWRQNCQRLAAAAQRLSAADVIHIQHNRFLWGGDSWAQFRHLSAFLQYCLSPIVVTLHDVYLERQPFTLRNSVKFLRHNYGPYHLLMQWLLRRVNQILVCTDEEARRLSEFLNQRPALTKLKVIPHFVEDRAVTIDRPTARRQLHLTGRVITLLGWIHPAKGHELLVQALPDLPADVQLVLAGKAGRGAEPFLNQLLDWAAEKGAADRIRVTGYLSEAELEAYLMATDLAVCPFQICSASGSLSTWISVARPILASDLPQIAEYNRLQPGAIRQFAPYTAAALTAAIEDNLAELVQHDPAVAALRDQLRLSSIVDRHLAVYTQSTSLAPPLPANAMAIPNRV